MDPLALIALLTATAVDAVVPGPCMAFVIARATVGGFPAGLRAALGSSVASFMLLCATWFIMAGLLHVSEAAFGMLRWGGIAVLVVFGIALMRAPDPAAAGPRAPVRARLGDLSGGFLTNFFSPVHLVFLLAVVPQFVDIGATDAATLAALTGAIVIITTLPLIALAALGARAIGLLRNRVHLVARGAGATLLGLAALAVMGGTA